MFRGNRLQYGGVSAVSVRRLAKNRLPSPYQRRISHFGNACWSFLMPWSVSLV